VPADDCAVHPACLHWPSACPHWPPGCLPACRLFAGLDKCKDLNTLVLSHNAITSLGSWVATCAKLEKLSMSHNQLAELGASLK
jgi:Leucine-rich repeat (LRR) protein